MGEMKRCGAVRRVAVGAAALALLGTTGCGQTAQESTRYIRIGVVEYSNDTFISETVASFQEDIQAMQTDDMSISVLVKNAEGSQRTEDTIVEDLIDSGCDVLCINLVDRSAGTNIIDLAIERDIPVIFFNREPVHEDLMRGDNLYYVGSYAAEGGILQGELAADAIRDNPGVDRNKDGQIQFVMLQGESGHQDMIMRTKSAVATLEEQGVVLDKLSYSIANWSHAEGMTRMAQLIHQYGTDIELVLSNNDDMALGAVDAYEQTDISSASRPIILGVDGTKEGLQAVADGQLTATVYHDGDGQAEMMARLSMALVTDRDLSGFTFENDRCVYLSFEKVTMENVKEYLER